MSYEEVEKSAECIGKTLFEFYTNRGFPRIHRQKNGNIEICDKITGKVLAVYDKNQNNKYYWTCHLFDEPFRIATKNGRLRFINGRHIRGRDNFGLFIITEEILKYYNTIHTDANFSKRAKELTKDGSIDAKVKQIMEDNNISKKNFYLLRLFAIIAYSNSNDEEKINKVLKKLDEESLTVIHRLLSSSSFGSSLFVKDFVLDIIDKLHNQPEKDIKEIILEEVFERETSLLSNVSMKLDGNYVQVLLPDLIALDDSCSLFYSIENAKNTENTKITEHDLNRLKERLDCVRRFSSESLIKKHGLVKVLGTTDLHNNPLVKGIKTGSITALKLLEEKLNLRKETDCDNEEIENLKKRLDLAKIRFANSNNPKYTIEESFKNGIVGVMKTFEHNGYDAVRHLEEHGIDPEEYYNNFKQLKKIQESMEDLKKQNKRFNKLLKELSVLDTEGLDPDILESIEQLREKTRACLGKLEKEDKETRERQEEAERKLKEEKLKAALRAFTPDIKRVSDKWTGASSYRD